MLMPPPSPQSPSITEQYGSTEKLSLRGIYGKGGIIASITADAKANVVCQIGISDWISGN
eukprot:15340957-Ditylum_brightwellii.AAC.1